LENIPPMEPFLVSLAQSWYPQQVKLNAIHHGQHLFMNNDLGLTCKVGCQESVTSGETDCIGENSAGDSVSGAETCTICWLLGFFTHEANLIYNDEQCL
jgi:hypothetical protein